MQANDQFLSVIEKLISKVKPVEALVEFVARKIVPTVSAGAASCPGSSCGNAGWGGGCGCVYVGTSGLVACGSTTHYQYKRYYTTLYRSSAGAPCGSCTVVACKTYSCYCA